MTNPIIQMPIILKIEAGIIGRLSSYLNRVSNQKSKVLFVSDNVIFSLYGKYVSEQLEQHYSQVNSIINQENTISNSFELTSYILSNDLEVIIGMGGGKVLDVCKHAAFMSKIKFISIPTALAHDGVASPIAVLETENGIRSLGCGVPSGILIDLNIIKDSPTILKKAGIGDTLSNFTAILDWKFAESKGKESINDFALLLSNTAFNALFNFKNRDLNDYGFLNQLAESIVLSGLAMNIAGSSRPCSGSEHLISHSMDLFGSNNLHGMQVAVSSIVSASLFNMDTSGLINFLKEFGLPSTFHDLGFDKSNFIEIIQKARETRPNRYTILDEIDLSSNNLERIYNKIYK
jgi:glycerol-1-phosphate dehydrogenase [NAD(P)+]